MKSDEKGYTLIGVLAIFTIISVFVLSLVMLSFSSLNSSKHESTYQSAFYIAEAGVNKEIVSLKAMVNDIYENMTDSKLEQGESISFVDLFNDELSSKLPGEHTYEQFESIHGEQPKTTVQVKMLDKNNRKYMITATATIGDNQKRKVKQEFTVGDAQDDGSHLFGDGRIGNFTAYAFNKLNIKHGVLSSGQPVEFPHLPTIAGDIGVASGEKNSIEVDDDSWPTMSGKVVIPSHDRDIVNIKLNNDRFKKNQRYKRLPMPVFPDYPDKVPTNTSTCINLSDNNICMPVEDKHLGKVTLDNQQLTFKLSKNTTIYMENLTMENNSSIHVDGTGRLTIYSKDGIDITKSDIYSLENSNTTIYTQGDFKVDGGSIQGSVYAKKDILIKNSTFQGNFFSEHNITLDNANGDGELIYTPFGKVEANRSPVTNMLLGENVTLKGGNFGYNHFEASHFSGPLSKNALHYYIDNPSHSESSPNITINSDITFSPLYETR